MKKKLSSIRNYLFSSENPMLVEILDQQSARNISNIGLVVFFFETAAILAFMTMEGWKFEGASLVSLISVGFCALFSLIVFLISRKLISRSNAPHWMHVAFKLVFYVIYTLWAIHVDIRHYLAGDQMLTFFTVQLMMVCFVMIKPWMGILLTVGAYAGLYAAAFFVRGAEGIDPFNYIILMILSIVGMCVRYDTQLDLARREDRMINEALVLEKYMRQDALTGLQNRLALEEYAKGVDGSRLTAYMIDINFFKEVNDRYGHTVGDSLLKETGSVLRNLYPGASYYRYGGDEFLVLSGKNPGKNYPETSYGFDLETEKAAVHVTLAIGIAESSPADYDEFFKLISRADDAMYAVKASQHKTKIR